MNEPTQEDLAPSSDLSRRKMLQRSAFVVGAAAVWSTPVVKSLGQRPAAANTDTVSPYWLEFSLIAAEVTISGDPITSRNGTWIVKYDGSDDGTEGEWEFEGAINCPQYDFPDEKSTKLGSDLGMEVESTTDPTETEVRVCYKGDGRIDWTVSKTVIKIGSNCFEPERFEDPVDDWFRCAVFETEP